jgi:hypothetical protein
MKDKSIPPVHVRYPKLYKVYHALKARCYNPKNAGFKRYGGRGIRVCDAWLNDVALFAEWSITNGYQEGLEIDRINNDGNYEPTNCRWVTQTENIRNSTVVKMIHYKGETRAMSEWCVILNLTYRMVQKRIKNGWTPEQAFETPFIPLNLRSKRRAS